MKSVFEVLLYFSSTLYYILIYSGLQHLPFFYFIILISDNDLNSQSFIYFNIYMYIFVNFREKGRGR